MALLIFFAFVSIPMIEIALFIVAGQNLGLFPTLALVVVTAMIGTALLHAQGLAAVRRAQSHLDRNEMPIEEVFVGVFLLVAGALLLTPGFLTDALGFLLFVPAVRRHIGKALFRRLLNQGRPPRGGRGDRRPSGPVIIEGDFEDLDDADDDGPPRRPRGPS